MEHNFNSRPRMRANLSGACVRSTAASFQLPPSHEGERPGPRSWLRYEQFQLPPSHEGERWPPAPSTPSQYFNSRPRMRANFKATRSELSAFRKFQLPPSHEGEPRGRPTAAGRPLFQLPPSHEGEHDYTVRVWPYTIISTPALA